jgi:hypothetical protein
MLLKADSKDLEFEWKMNQEDKRAMQQTGGKFGNFMSESGRWALSNISTNEMRGEYDSGCGADVGNERGGREGWKDS